MKPGFLYLIIFSLLLVGKIAIAQNNHEPWNYDQLMSPGVLADRITHHHLNGLLLISVGPGALIKGSVDMGPAHETTNNKKLQDYLKTVKNDTEIVIYCGCCPFDKCPNIRPAFTMLAEMGFKNAKLLNLPKNIKTDWLDKHYPVAE
jgi:hypothetical protein